MMNADSPHAGSADRSSETADRTSSEHPCSGVETRASSILHDLRNALLIIHARSAELMADLADASQRSAHADLHAAIECAVGIARAETLDERTDLAGLVEELAPLIRAALPSSVRVDIEVPQGLEVWIRGDRVAMSRAILNLCMNARAAMLEGGRLSIVLGLVELTREEPAQPRRLGPGRYARIAAIDTGHGMAAEELTRIFDCRYSTRSGPERGLGLAITADALGRLGGGVRVESTPGAGSTFELLAPLDETVEDPSASRARGGDDPAG